MSFFKKILLFNYLKNFMISKDELLEKIKKSGFDYKLYNHEPLFTVEESVNFRGKIEGAHSKNLFLKNKKNEFFLFTCLETTKIEIKKIAKK